MEIYINKLIENLDENINYKNINLIMDGGAFSGSYILGCLYYLKELEKIKKIEVNKVSGCSIGSILCVLYKLNQLNYCVDVYDNIRDYFREKGNLHILRNIVDEINKLMDKHFFEQCNNKIFISYYNIETNTYIIKKKYTSNEDLCESMFKSCYIPFICGSEFFYKGKYIDGLKPYHFKKGKSLFINLCMNTKCINGMLNIKNEVNNTERIMCGILDIHSFFSKSKSTTMCYYLDNMTYIQKILYFLRLSFINIVVTLLHSSHYLNTNFDFFKKNILSNSYVNNVKFIIYNYIKKYMV